MTMIESMEPAPRRVLVSRRPMATIRDKKGNILSAGHPTGASLNPDSADAPGGRVIVPAGRLTDTTVNTGFRIGGQSPDGVKVDLASVAFGTRLNKALEDYPAFYPQFATVIASDKLMNTEIWLNQIQSMSMWEGQRKIGAVSAEKTNIVTRPHENSIGISKSDIINDQLGLYGPLIDDMGRTYPQALDDMVITMLCAGIQGTALGATYDGQNLIDTDHTFRSADTGIAAFQYSNKVTGAFSSSVFQSAVTLYDSLKNEYGRPMRVGRGPSLLLYGPANRIPVRNVLKLDTAGTLNGVTLAQNLDVTRESGVVPVMCPWISARTTRVLGTNVTLTGLEWFLMPANSRAILLQIKRAVEAMSVEDGYQVFSEGRYFYGIEAEFGGNYGLPQEIVGGPGS